jgi:hypothetical protein
MAAKGDRNMYEIYNVYNIIHSHIFKCTCWFYFQSCVVYIIWRDDGNGPKTLTDFAQKTSSLNIYCFR